MFGFFSRLVVFNYDKLASKRFLFERFTSPTCPHAGIWPSRIGGQVHTLKRKHEIEYQVSQHRRGIIKTL